MEQDTAGITAAGLWGIYRQCWQTIVCLERDGGWQQEHYDFFFDQAGKQKKGINKKAKKDGQTGIHFLSELLDPALSPLKNGKSLLAQRFPNIQ